MQTISFLKSFAVLFAGMSKRKTRLAYFMASLICFGIVADPAQSGNRFRTDPDILGKIVDFDTKEPIPGVVVMALWTTDVFRLVIEPSEAYYDYFETLSDENGEFRIPGKGLILIRNINKPKIIVFKTGYPFLRLGDLGPRFIADDLFGKYVERVGDKVIISLRKTTMAERKESIKERRGVPFYEVAREGLPPEKYRLYTEEIRKEYTALGKVPPWERDYRYLQVVEGGVYPAGETAVKPQK